MPDKKCISQSENKSFKEVLNSLLQNNWRMIILAKLNINSRQNKFYFLSDGITENVDIFVISESKIYGTFLQALFFIVGYALP